MLSNLHSARRFAVAIVTTAAVVSLNAPAALAAVPRGDAVGVTAAVPRRDAVGVTAAVPRRDAAPTKLCEVADQQLHELSGLVATKDGYVAINDSNDVASAMRVFFLDANCRLTRSVRYPTAARDPEDLASGPDGTLWVSDAGDNLNASTHRQSVAVWKLKPGATAPVLYRMTYPDGHHDCEAMLIDGDGLPVLITKELGGAAAVYKPTAALVANTTAGTPMSLVGHFTPKATGTPNPFSTIGQSSVTGAGMSADRKRLVVRTYADAYVFDLKGQDVVATLESSPAEVVALPDEPQGESVTFAMDGTALVTVSDAQAATPLLRYPLTGKSTETGADASARPAGSGTGAAGAGSTGRGRAPAKAAAMAMSNRALLIVGLVGGLLVLVGWVALLRRRGQARW